MSSLSTHVLDASTGLPADGVPVQLEARGDNGWATIGAGRTDTDGRIQQLAPGDLSDGVYRLTFDTAAYHAATSQWGFFPEVSITFVIDQERHYHVPLLLSPFAYSTYRGS